ncbi:YebC/PmpR family DNA-binding transcriptional regulator, partial [Longimicrobium sp.]|uniref:YebC/PmpR family DNA-binding transcriptional regulator n=1 Tax=Longimicrobium sp. TaxID=2029185 RepID=UPI002F95B1FA
DAEKHDEETVMMAALDAGALDVETGEDGHTVYTEVADFHAVQDALRAAGIEWEDAELAMIPKTEIRVEGADAEQLVKLLDLLEELDDVQKVYTNADLDADALAGV